MLQNDDRSSFFLALVQTQATDCCSVVRSYKGTVVMDVVSEVVALVAGY